VSLAGGPQRHGKAPRPDLEAVDVSFDRSWAPLEGEAVLDGVVVTLDAECEGVQVGLVVGLDGGDPVVESLALAAGEDLRECSDVAGQV